MILDKKSPDSRLAQTSFSSPAKHVSLDASRLSVSHKLQSLDLICNVSRSLDEALLEISRCAVLASAHAGQFSTFSASS